MCRKAKKEAKANPAHAEDATQLPQVGQAVRSSCIGRQACDIPLVNFHQVYSTWPVPLICRLPASAPHDGRMPSTRRCASEVYASYRVADNQCHGWPCVMLQLVACCDRKVSPHSIFAVAAAVRVQCWLLLLHHRSSIAIVMLVPCCCSYCSSGPLLLLILQLSSPVTSAAAVLLKAPLFVLQDASYQPPTRHQQARTSQLSQQDMELIELIAADTIIADRLGRKVQKLEQRLQHLGDLQHLEERIADLRQQEAKLQASCQRLQKTRAAYAAQFAKESQPRSPLGLSEGQTSAFNDPGPALQHSSSNLPGNTDTQGIPSSQVSLEPLQDMSLSQQAAESSHAAFRNCQVTLEPHHSSSCGEQDMSLTKQAPAGSHAGTPVLNCQVTSEPHDSSSCVEQDVPLSKQAAEGLGSHAAARNCQVTSEGASERLWQPGSLRGWLSEGVTDSTRLSEEGQHVQAGRSSCSSVLGPDAVTAADPAATTEADATCVVYQNPLADTAPSSSRVSSTNSSDWPVASCRNSNTGSSTTVADYRNSSSSGATIGTEFYHDNLSTAADTVSAVDAAAAIEEPPQRAESPWCDKKPLLHGILHISHGPVQSRGQQSHLQRLQQHCRNIFNKIQRVIVKGTDRTHTVDGMAHTGNPGTNTIWRRSSSGRGSLWDWGSATNSRKTIAVEPAVVPQQV
eukprot:GHUV01009756.1.p1 GENE.GHUV01009756.1~~GHUV01009756.1.p1  ORF type:complete len:682 (+),score=207.56 GHUV01009756.1:2837-4882(+)